MKNRLVCVALGVGLIAALLGGCGGGGSSDDSSEWSASDLTKVESRISEELAERGFSPTPTQTQCIAKGLEPLATVSEVLSNSNPNAQQGAEIEDITVNCLGGSDESGSSEESDSSEAGGSFYSGPACEEELASSACIQEVEEKESTAMQEGEETYGGPAEEAELEEEAEGFEPGDEEEGQTP